jgi:HrpA-like RNA helicase
VVRDQVSEDRLVKKSALFSRWWFSVSYALFLLFVYEPGKSTQVPQFLLDANPTCSIVVTQPRRISAIAIAERIVEEQGQGSVGDLIGYQVRLESAVTADTQLVFMTPGVLLRKMQSSPQLSEYTHIIIDEIHERDKYQEFLLIVLRDLLPVRTDLRVVLMSATLQTVALVDFFAAHGLQPAVVEMEGRMFPVQEFFLEQVLEMTGYIDATTGYDGGTKLEEELAKLTGQNQQQMYLQTNVSIQCAMCGKQGFLTAIELGEHIALCDGFLADDTDDDERAPTNSEAASDISSTRQLDNTLELSQFEDCDVDVDLDFEEYDVDGKMELGEYDIGGLSSVQASTSVTRPAMVDEKAGLNFGNDVNADSEVTKWDGASSFGEAIDGVAAPTQTEQALLDAYQTMHDDETIDTFLLLEVVQYIVKSSYGDGGILIFFPGWQEISEFTLMLEGTAPFYDRSKFLILPLHSGIPSRDQRRVLQRPPQGVRKIVLSTNIAETSLTIDDIAFVVDTGRAKEKNYDPHLKTSTLQPTWVSQASAKQRKGRAGRVKAGVCFHLFSSRRHQSMRPFTESELLRTPLVSEKDFFVFPGMNISHYFLSLTGGDVSHVQTVGASTRRT